MQDHLHLPVLLLAIVWALNPYLGLRTTGANTVFSQPPHRVPDPNHLFMPSWRLTDWQEDMVVLVSSTDAELQAGADNDLALPLAIGGPADDCRHHDEAGEIAAGRAEHVGEADALFRRALEHRQAGRAFRHVKQQRWRRRAACRTR